MQNEDKESVEKGITLGQEIIVDKEGVTNLLRKVEANNSQYKRKRKVS